MTEVIPEINQEEEDIRAAYVQHTADLNTIIANGSPFEKKLAQGQKFLFKFIKSEIERRRGE